MLKNLFNVSVIGLTLLGASSASALEIHEWGTFTSLVNEDGQQMSGMHHEEEGLPGFVYGLRNDGPGLQNSSAQIGLKDRCRGKCVFLTAEESLKSVIPFNQFNTTITQKMETPVIYFYGDVGEKVQVEVGFPGGMISQWYPAASQFNLHPDFPNNGFMSWNVALKEVNDTKLYPKTSQVSVWNPARVTKANTIQTQANGTEEERFIFYRGLGDFSVPLKVSLKNLTNAMEVTVTNNSTQTVPALFYLKTNELGVERLLVIPSLKPSESRTVSTSLAQNVSDAYQPILKELVSAGLFEDEAMSMLKTWDKSYFHTKGERLLYILPQAWTETILPMKLQPAPEKLVRVLIGRVELFSASEQAQLSQKVVSNDTSILSDRLLEPKLNALKAGARLQKSNQMTMKINKLIHTLNQD